MQQLDADGTLGVEVFRSGSALRQTVDTGVFNPSKSGWLDIQIYDATPGFSNPSQDLATYPDLPTVEIGTIIEPGLELPILSQPSIPEPLPKLSLIRSQPTLRWTAEPDVFYLVQKSTDLKNWSFSGMIEGEGRPLEWVGERNQDGEENARSAFYRIVPMPVIPPLESR